MRLPTSKRSLLWAEGTAILAIYAFLIYTAAYVRPLWLGPVWFSLSASTPPTRPPFHSPPPTPPQLHWGGGGGDGGAVRLCYFTTATKLEIPLRAFISVSDPLPFLFPFSPPPPSRAPYPRPLSRVHMARRELKKKPWFSVKLLPLILST